MNLSWILFPLGYEFPHQYRNEAKPSKFRFHWNRNHVPAFLQFVCSPPSTKRKISCSFFRASLLKAHTIQDYWISTQNPLINTFFFSRRYEWRNIPCVSKVGRRRRGREGNFGHLVDCSGLVGRVAGHVAAPLRTNKPPRVTNQFINGIKK